MVVGKFIEEGGQEGMKQTAIDAIMEFIGNNLEDTGEHIIDLNEKFCVVFDFRTENNTEYFRGTYDLPPHYSGEIKGIVNRAMLLELDNLGVVRNSEDITTEIPVYREII